MNHDPNLKPNDENHACGLCHLPVEVSGFELTTIKGLKRFCCEGVYQMLHGDTLFSLKKEPWPEA